MKMKKIILKYLAVLVLSFILSIILVLGTDGDPSEFGDSSSTTCYIGGSVGIMNCTGQLFGVTLNTGNGANELYPMNQGVLTSNSPSFTGMSLTGNLGMNVKNITNVNCIVFNSGGQICSGS